MGICESKPKDCEVCYELFNDNDDRLLIEEDIQT